MGGFGSSILSSHPPIFRFMLLLELVLLSVRLDEVNR